MPLYKIFVSTSCAACGTATIKAETEEDARELAEDMNYWRFDWDHDLSAEQIDIDQIEEA